MAPALSSDQIARREDLKRLAVLASLLLNPPPRQVRPDPLEPWRRLQGKTYFELDQLDVGRQETAALVGLGPKAIDWARNKYKTEPIDPIDAFRVLFLPVIDYLASLDEAALRALFGEDIALTIRRLESQPA